MGVSYLLKNFDFCFLFVSLKLEQPVKEFRPPMSEVVGSLSRLIQKLNYMGKGKGVEVDPFERSFRSTNSQFMGSPSMSYLSI